MRKFLLTTLAAVTLPGLALGIFGWGEEEEKSSNQPSFFTSAPETKLEDLSELTDVQLIDKMVNDDDLTVRHASAGILGSRKVDAAIKPLTDIFFDEEEQLMMRTVALRTLEAIGGEEAFDAMVRYVSVGKDPALKSQVVYSIAEIDDPRKVDVLIKLIKDTPSDDLQTHQMIIRSLAQMDDDASLDALLGMLKPSTNSQLATAALGAVYKRAPEKAVDASIELYTATDDVLLKRTVLQVLTLSDRKGIAPMLATILSKETNPQHQQMLLKKLAELKDPETITAILPFIEADTPQVYMFAVYAAGELGDARAAPAMVRLWDKINEEDKPGQGKFDGRGFDRKGLAGKGYDEMGYGKRGGGRDRLSELNPQEQIKRLQQKFQFQTALIRALQQTSPTEGQEVFFSIAEPVVVEEGSLPPGIPTNVWVPIRALAVGALADVRDPTIAQRLIDKGWLTDDNASIRAASVKTLGLVGNDSALSALTKTLSSDESPRVRWNAAAALGYIGNDRAVRALTKALDDPHPEVVIQALRSLGHFQGPTVVKALNDTASNHPNETVQDVAREVLKQVR